MLRCQLQPVENQAHNSRVTNHIGQVVCIICRHCRSEVAVVVAGHHLSVVFGRCLIDQVESWHCSLQKVSTLSSPLLLNWAGKNLSATGSKGKIVRWCQRSHAAERVSSDIYKSRSQDPVFHFLSLAHFDICPLSLMSYMSSLLCDTVVWND